MTRAPSGTFGSGDVSVALALLAWPMPDLVSCSSEQSARRLCSLGASPELQTSTSAALRSGRATLPRCPGDRDSPAGRAGRAILPAAHLAWIRPAASNSSCSCGVSASATPTGCLLRLLDTHGGPPKGLGDTGDRCRRALPVCAAGISAAAVWRPRGAGPPSWVSVG